MLKLYFLLFWEFNKIGLLAIGGGYAAIPFLYYLQSRYQWYTLDELADMTAIASITPGPVGINMATFAGLKTAGLFGALTATISIVLCPFISAVIITKLAAKFHNNKNVNFIFSGLRCAASALLSYIALKMLIQAVSFKSFLDFDKASLILFAVLIIPFSFVKKNPILTIFLGALGGLFVFGL